jgi:UDP-N-acetylglucosamine:LPS N-acetylglucosamine transferase
MTIRVLAVASAGGHLTQLILSLSDAQSSMDIQFATTKPSFAPKGITAHELPDFSRENMWRAAGGYKAVKNLIYKLEPHVIITTGAAPGLIALIAGRRMGIRTIWLDSCANYERLSLSGRIANYTADLVLTQWPHLSSPTVSYRGSVL